MEIAQVESDAQVITVGRYLKRALMKRLGKSLVLVVDINVDEPAQTVLFIEQAPPDSRVALFEIANDGGQRRTVGQDLLLPPP